MTEKVNSLPVDQFVAIWNNAESLDDAVAQVQAIVGRPAPRWAVMARAGNCRKDGIPMKRFEGTTAKAAG